MVKMDRETAKKIAITVLIAAIGLFIVSTVSDNTEKVRNVTTPYNTTCKLNIGGGLIGDGEITNKNEKKISFKDLARRGFFISTSKDKVDGLINYIPTIGTKHTYNGVTWYNVKGQNSDDLFNAFKDAHLKLKRADEYDIGFMESPDSDEVIILVASPRKLVDCFNSVKWGNESLEYK